MNWTELSEPNQNDLFHHFGAIQHDIREEIARAGIELVDADYHDETWDRYFQFKTSGDLGRFLSMVEAHPNRYTWEIAPQGTVVIPPLDLYTVLKHIRAFKEGVITTMITLN